MRTTLDCSLYLPDIICRKIFPYSPNLGFSSYGSKVSDEIEKIEYKLKYLTMPVLAKYSLPGGVTFFAGPQMALLLSSKGELEGHETDVKEYVW